VLRFPKQREQDEQGKHGGLDKDRKNESRAAQPAFATTLLWIAFDETSA
jgi:hypothetical protein